MAASVSKSCVPDYFRCHISECTQIPPEPVMAQQNRGYADRYVRQSAHEVRQGPVEWKAPMKTTRPGSKCGAKPMSFLAPHHHHHLSRLDAADRSRRGGVHGAGSRPPGARGPRRLPGATPGPLRGCRSFQLLQPPRATKFWEKFCAEPLRVGNCISGARGLAD